MHGFHGFHIMYESPHGWLIILAFIFAIGGVVRWRPGSPPRLVAIAWFSWSWLFFVAAFIFGP